MLLLTEENLKKVISQFNIGEHDIAYATIYWNMCIYVSVKNVKWYQFFRKRAINLMRKTINSYMPLGYKLIVLKNFDINSLTTLFRVKEEAVSQSR